jgi:hypothetical protein
MQLEIQLAPVLHEVLNLVMHLLLGTMQTAQPGSNGSSSGTRSGGRSSSAGASFNAWDPSPGAAVNVLSCVIAVLLPLATRSVLAQQAGNNSSANKALSATWVLLLLRLTAALEQGMRFEAQCAASRAEVEGAAVFGGISGQLAKDVPNWTASWLATFLLLSPTAHEKYGWMYEVGDKAKSGDQEQPALLKWMLDNTPPNQLPAAQQRMLSLLCTMAKVGVSAEGSKQLCTVHLACSGMLSTAKDVLMQLLTQQPAGFGTATSSAAQPAATPGSSSSSSSQASGSAAAAGGHNTAGSVQTDAVLSWLSLLGRCFLQASQQMSSSLERRVAVLLAAAAGDANKPLPQPKPVKRSALASSSAASGEVQDARFNLESQERQLLQGAGRQLAEHCSRIGMDL